MNTTRPWIATAILFFGLAGGCASTGPDHSNAPSAGPSHASPGVSTAGPAASVQHPAHAECLVCKYNADLACVDVEVEKDTPTYVFNGKTYYFCSNECRNHFAKNPQKYAGK